MLDFITLKIPRLYIIIFILLSTVGCDQATKAVARDAISHTGSISYFKSALTFKHAENPGAFLSMGAKLPKKSRSIIFTGLVSLFLLVLGTNIITRKYDFSQTLAMSLVLSGGIGNLIDRIHKGSVTDFLIINTKYYSTGIFNIADLAIVLGVVILFFLSLNKSPELTNSPQLTST